MSSYRRGGAKPFVPFSGTGQTLQSSPTPAPTTKPLSNAGSGNAITTTTSTLKGPSVSFGNANATTTSTLKGPSFDFGNAITTTTSTLKGPSFDFGNAITTTTSTLKGPSVSFGNVNTTPTSTLKGPSVSFGNAIPTTTSTLKGPSVSFGNANTTTTSTLKGPSFDFGNAKTTTTSTLKGPCFDFGKANTTTTSTLKGPSFNFGNANTTTTSTLKGPSFSFGNAFSSSTTGSGSGFAVPSPFANSIYSPSSAARSFAGSGIPPGGSAATARPPFSAPTSFGLATNGQVATTATSTTTTIAPTTGRVDIFSKSSLPPKSTSGAVNFTRSATVSTTAKTNGEPPRPRRTETVSGASAAVSPTPASQLKEPLKLIPSAFEENGVATPMNLPHLQETINRCGVEISNQEKLYLDQAAKINAKDLGMVSNGDKIAKLNESVSRVKADQACLEHAFEYLKNQQDEFETVLGPLEVDSPLLPMEPEREHLYTLTESVDIQLNEMAADLKEIINKINESNRTADENDPMAQILKILNEHTDALQWVEESTSKVRRSIDDITRHHQGSTK